MKTNVSEVRNAPGIISGSKVMIDEGSRPKRVVMREVVIGTNEFVVQIEYLDASIEIEEISSPGKELIRRPVLVFTHSSYDDPPRRFEYEIGANQKSKKSAAEKALRTFKELVRKM